MNGADGQADNCCDPIPDKYYKLTPSYRYPNGYLIETLHQEGTGFGTIATNGNKNGWGWDSHLHSGNHPSGWEGCWGLSNNGLSTNFWLHDNKTNTDLFVKYGLKAPNTFGDLSNLLILHLGENWANNPNRSFELIFTIP